MVGYGVSPLPLVVSVFVGDGVGADDKWLSGLSVEGLLVGPMVVMGSTPGIGVGLVVSHVPFLSALVGEGVGAGEKIPLRSPPVVGLPLLLAGGATVGTSPGMITVGLDVYPLPTMLSSGAVVGDEVGANVDEKMSPSFPLLLPVDGLDVGAKVKLVFPPRVVSEGLLVGYPATKPVGVGVGGAVPVAGVLVYARALGAGEPVVEGVELPSSGSPSGPVIGPAMGTPTETGGEVEGIA